MISKKLVKLMNGEIGFKNNKNQGTTFWFTAHFEKRENPLTDRPVLAGKKILVLTQDDFLRKSLRNQLEKRGMRVFYSQDAKNEPDLAIIETPNLEITDLIEFSSDLAMRISDQIPCLFVTSCGNPEPSRAHAKMRIIKKPVRQSELYTSISELIFPIFEQPLKELKTHISLSKFNGELILVVDDTPVNQALTTTMLKKFNLKSDAVANGMEAVSAVKRNPSYSAILMDCMMPEMDGYEASRVIKELQLPTHIPIIAMTALAFDTDLKKCLASGMDDVLVKPVKLEELSQMLCKWITPLSNTNGVELKMSLSEIDPPLLDKGTLKFLEELSQNEIGFIENLMRLFFENAPMAISQLKQAIATDDVSSAQQAAHKFKGLCLNVGAVSTGKLSGIIEMNAQNGSLDGAGQTFEVIGDLYEKVKLALMDWQKGVHHQC